MRSKPELIIVAEVKLQQIGILPLKILPRKFLIYKKKISVFLLVFENECFNHIASIFKSQIFYIFFFKNVSIFNHLKYCRFWNAVAELSAPFHLQRSDIQLISHILWHILSLTHMLELLHHFMLKLQCFDFWFCVMLVSEWQKVIKSELSESTKKQNNFIQWQPLANVF